MKPFHVSNFNATPRTPAPLLPGHHLKTRSAIKLQRTHSKHNTHTTTKLQPKRGTRYSKQVPALAHSSHPPPPGPLLDRPESGPEGWMVGHQGQDQLRHPHSVEASDSRIVQVAQVFLQNKKRRDKKHESKAKKKEKKVNRYLRCFEKKEMYYFRG